MCAVLNNVVTLSIGLGTEKAGKWCENRYATVAWTTVDMHMQSRKAVRSIKELKL